MLALLRSSRPLNLLIIVLTMLLLEYALIAPILRTMPFYGAASPFETSRLHFGLLILSTLLIAAAGNIINDYFDLRADRINKPEKVLIGKRVKRRVAMATHFILNSIALLIAAWISWKNWVWGVFLFQLFAASVLWFYSLFLKHQPLIGNFMIAVITAMIPVLLLLFELPPLLQSYRGEMFDSVRDAIVNGIDPSERLWLILFWILGYAAFAFITTLIRELQKDLADIEGDRKVGSRTLPIVLGEKKGRQLTGLFILLFVIGLGLSWHFFLGDLPSLAYVLGAIGTPTLVSGIVLFQGKGQRSYERAAAWMKISMLTGILFLIFAHYAGPETIFFP